MVYLRVPTVVFYIIQAAGYRISALQHFREVRRQVSTSRMGSTFCRRSAERYLGLRDLQSFVYVRGLVSRQTLLRSVRTGTFPKEALVVTASFTRARGRLIFRSIDSQASIVTYIRWGKPQIPTPMHEMISQDVAVLGKNAPRCMELHRVELRQRRGLHQFPRLALEAVLTPLLAASRLGLVPIPRLSPEDRCQRGQSHADKHSEPLTRPLPLLVHPHPAPRLYDRGLDRRVRVL
jgi:hypothetical protein